MSGQAEPAQAYPAPPSYMRELVDRAALLIRVHGPGASVEFTRFADGEDHRYLARLEWPAMAWALRVVVFDFRTGDLVCQSLESDLFEVDPDPARWQIDVAPDEAERFMFHRHRLTR